MGCNQRFVGGKTTKSLFYFKETRNEQIAYEIHFGMLEKNQGDDHKFAH